MALLRKIVFKFLSGINYYYRAVSVYHHSGKTLLKPAQKLLFAANEQGFLELCAQASNFEHDYSTGSRVPEIAVTELKNVSLLGNSGALVLQQRVVTESVVDQRRLSLSPAWRMPAFMLPKTKNGYYTAIFHFPWAETSNYHWFFDALSRLYALAQFVKEPIILIVNQNMPKFQSETLQFVLKDLPQFSVMEIGKNEKWICEKFLLPSFVVHKGGGFLPKEISAFLRDKIFAGYQISNNKPVRRIYISRSTATKRRIKNEAELLPVLKENGFEVVYPEKLSYRDQVQLFYESRYIVGPHGAGFTNTFFAEKATVLELHPATAIKAHYFLLCKGLDFEYHYLVGSAADEKLDFTIPVALFNQKLVALLA